MPSIAWFTAVAILFLLPFAYLCWKIQDRRIPAVYLMMAGVTYLFEYIVFILLDSYAYHPHILPDPYLDDLLGAFVSDAFVIPMASSMAGVLQFTWKSIFLLAGFISLIERFFIHLRIFDLHWWSTFFTLGGTTAWLWIGKLLFNRLARKPSAFLRYGILYAANLLVLSSLIYLTVTFFHTYQYRVGWFANTSRDHVAFSTAYVMLQALAFSASVLFRLHWFWKVLIVLLTLPLDWILLRLQILHLSPGWSLLHFAVERLVVLLFLGLVNRLVLDQVGEKRPSVIRFK